MREHAHAFILSGSQSHWPSSAWCVRACAFVRVVVLAVEGRKGHSVQNEFGVTGVKGVEAVRHIHRQTGVWRACREGDKRGVSRSYTRLYDIVSKSANGVLTLDAHGPWLKRRASLRFLHVCIPPRACSHFHERASSHLDWTKPTNG